MLICASHSHSIKRHQKFKNKLSLPAKHHEKDIGKYNGQEHVLTQNMGMKGKHA
ncbi:hypothetical protein NC651_011094 [Populus alba x Populus x berolinensis]|nr:hypothetical protein NC651_011094 [Populus alba x Populus x berolinensis]